MKYVLELLQNEYEKHSHYSEYPQDGPLWEKSKPTIKVLNTFSETSKNRAEEFKKAIEILKKEI